MTCKNSTREKKKTV